MATSSSYYRQNRAQLCLVYSHFQSKDLEVLSRDESLIHVDKCFMHLQLHHAATQALLHVWL